MSWGDFFGFLALAGQIGGAVLTRAEKGQYRAIATNLRTIYFTPEGTLRLLENILQGKEITHYDVQELSHRLRKTEQEVSKALSDMEITFHEAGIDILIRDNEIYEKIRNQKLSIRRDIKNCILWPLAADRIPDREEVQRLQADIKNINAAIVDLEANLKH